MMKFMYEGKEFDSQEPIILGKDLKFMRVSNSITTTEAAEIIGLKSRKTIENWEMGNSQPSIVKFIAMCLYYQYDPHLVIRACINRAIGPQPGEEQPAIDLSACRLG